jgi:hypothetical protein
MTETHINEKPLERVLSRLDRVRDVGGGKYKALCPAHGDRNPSLSIKEANNGGVVLNCFAGCKTEDVLSAAGLTMRDLFPGNVRPIRKKEIVKVYDYHDAKR